MCAASTGFSSVGRAFDCSGSVDYQNVIGSIPINRILNMRDHI